MQTAFTTLGTLRFEQVPHEHRVRAFDVDYVLLREDDGGELYVTRYGWQLLEYLLPQRWYHERRYQSIGERLPGGTSAVYRLPMRSSTGRLKHIIVKFSRFAQDVPIHIDSDEPTHIPRSIIDNARFNSPFEEFGCVTALRRNRIGSPPQGIRTKRPLAIYCPAKEYPVWQTGRTRGRFQIYQSMMRQDQLRRGTDKPIELHLQREYVMLYEWVKGEDAEALYEQGVLTMQQLHGLTHRVVCAMVARGYWVLDNKPRHYILRRRRGTHELMHHQGELTYALVDFELLQRIDTAIETIPAF